MSPGVYSWESKHNYAPSVIKDGNLFKMWYSAHDGKKYVLGYAESTDGLNWNKHSSPVLSSPNSWATDVVSPYVIKDGNIYKMWFQLTNANVNKTAKEKFRLAYAESTDGLDWNVVNSNLLGATQTLDREGVGAPTVLKSGIYYLMWYKSIHYY